MLDLCNDLRGGIWTELRLGQTIDTYRRNLQRAHVERLEFLMTKEQVQPPARFRQFIGFTAVDVSQSDIRAIARAELKELDRMVVRATARTRDRMSRIHLEDMHERIDMILNPRG